MDIIARRWALAALAIALLTCLDACDTTDDDYASSDDYGSGSYSTTDTSYDSSASSSDSSGGYSSQSDSSNSTSYSSPSYEPAPSYTTDYSRSNDDTSLQNDLTEADNYHYNNDD